MKLAVTGIVMFALTMYGIKQVAYSLPITVRSLLIIGLFALFAWAVWNFVLDDIDRGAVSNMANLKKIPEKSL